MFAIKRKLRHRLRVVISQSMLFPWCGFLEQVRLADVFVHLDDVQFSKGGVVNRIQIKTEAGSKWMTVPLEGHKLGQAIDEVRVKPISDWRERHLGFLRQNLSGTPHWKDCRNLVEEVYSDEEESLVCLVRKSLLALCRYFNLDKNTKFTDVSDLQIGGSGSDRVLNIVKALGGDEYITGNGARNYLDHERFEDEGVRVSYMNYEMRPYPQQHGTFTPYVSGLDLLSNCGQAGQSCISSKATYWKDFSI